MSAVDWPTTLPQFPLADDLQGTRQSTILRTEMSWGPPKQRRKFSAYYEQFKLKMLMTKEQLIALRDFFDISLSNGSLEFNFKHPITEETKSCRFYNSYSYKYINGGYFEVTLPIEVLP